MTSTYYITTPLYYVNDEPHIGHAYTTILADVLARYRRLFDSDSSVHFLTGLDEHGQKVAQAAAKAGVEPQDHCDRMAVLWKNVWEKLNIRYDDFIRTTEPRHIEVVNRILTTINEKGDVYRKDYEGWYSVFEERFFTEKDLIDGKDPIGGRPVELIKESNYFFRMSKYQQWLIDHYTAHPDAVLPHFRMNEVLGFLRQPLDDLCISRPKSRLAWGIPIPWDNEYVTYVWFDALINYYSATITPPAGRIVAWPADYHLIGKDILTTHAVYWPIMLHAAGLEPPRHILAHGWWLAKDDAKMSKSSGNVVKPLALAEKYGVDAFRYVLMREMVVGQDAGFSEESFIQRYNSDLANDLGNLYSRLAKLWKQFDWSSVPRHGSYEDFIDNELPSGVGHAAGKLRELIREDIDILRPHAAIARIMEVISSLNRAIEKMEPWKAESRESASVAISMGTALDVLHNVAALLEPVMPEKMALLQKWMKPAGASFNPQPSGALFPRVAPPVFPPTTGGEVGKETVPEITIEDFTKLDIRVGKIVAAEAHPNADRLLVLQVDIGGEVRQVVAGIATGYNPAELTGRKVALLTNLKPVKLRGVESNGMVLAAVKGKNLALLTVDRESEPGTRIS